MAEDRDLSSLGDNLDADLQSLEILLFAKANRTALTVQEFIRLSLLNGADPETLRAELLRDLKEGGRIFSEFRRAVKSTSNGVLKRVSDSGQFAQLEGIQKFRWVAVGDKRVCDDCIKRHGKVSRMEHWESLGLPATGFTVCKENCRCVLVPEEVVQIDPITLEEVAAA